MGGPGTPPGKPGYRVMTLHDDDDQATAQLQKAEEAGFDVLFSVPADSNYGRLRSRVILSSYKGKQS